MSTFATHLEDNYVNLYTDNYSVKIMKKSALQIARASYQPKLPKALQGAVSVKEGEPTQSVDNQEEIKQLFPNTYGMPLVEFVPGNGSNSQQMNVGVILVVVRLQVDIMSSLDCSMP